jgi:ribose 1,5-bisphosphate isomerase
LGWRNTALRESVSVAADKIRRLEVQGARNVAIAAIRAIEEGANVSKAEGKEMFLKELSDAKEVLFASRATEPLMRNILRHIIHAVESSKKKTVEELAGVISEVSDLFLENLERSKEKIADIGAKRISHNSIVLTHCHSSTVTGMLRRAKEEGKSFEVVCTESRPVFQGRITAKELLEAGIRTTLIVDSAMRYFMNEVDLVVVGADAFTSEGNVVNKIGTSMVALAAKEARTPFYVVSELLKFDPATVCGGYEKIEERKTREVWDNPPRGLIIRNPAFDVTSRDFIHGVICEEGIISPHLVSEVVSRKYPWIF